MTVSRNCWFRVNIFKTTKRIVKTNIDQYTTDQYYFSVVFLNIFHVYIKKVQDMAHTKITQSSNIITHRSWWTCVLSPRNEGDALWRVVKQMGNTKPQFCRGQIVSLTSATTTTLYSNTSIKVIRDLALALPTCLVPSNKQHVFFLQRNNDTSQEIVPIDVIFDFVTIWRVRVRSVANGDRLLWIWLSNVDDWLKKTLKHYPNSLLINVEQLWGCGRSKHLHTVDTDSTSWWRNTRGDTSGRRAHVLVTCGWRRQHWIPTGTTRSRVTCNNVKLKSS